MELRQFSVDVGPCRGVRAGMGFTDWCPDCGHVVIAHKQDKTCSVCQAVEDIAL